MTNTCAKKRERDPVKERLESLGVEFSPYRLNEGAEQIGWTFTVNGAEFTYRWAGDDPVDPHVWIVAYRNDTPRKGMRNPFIEFLWFVDLLCDPVFELATIYGAIQPLEREEGLPDGLGRERIIKYYRILGGRVDGMQWRDTKMSVDVPYYRDRYSQRIPPQGLPN